MDVTLLKRLFLAFTIAIVLIMGASAGAGAWSTQVVDTRIDREFDVPEDPWDCSFRDPKTGEIIYFPCRLPIDDPATY
jgi:hypothetical protein